MSQAQEPTQPNGDDIQFGDVHGSKGVATQRDEA